MLSGTMVYAGNGKRNVQNEHHLLLINVMQHDSMVYRNFTQAAAAKPSSHPNAFCMYRRQYIRNETKIVVKTRKSE
jgi:hypothetical protein